MPDNVIPFWRKLAERAQADEAKRAQVFEQRAWQSLPHVACGLDATEK